jgi:hypothetical protein
MPLNFDEEEWLRQAGYEYYSFVSWPHTNDKDVSDFARRVSEDLEGRLSGLISGARVFFDGAVFKPGDIWPQALRDALCRSISMVAVCAPMYYHPQHRWCGLEWEAMRVLGGSRLQGNTFGSIIPVVARIRGPLPDAVTKIVQYHDFSDVMTYSASPYRTNEYKQMIGTIADRIVDVAEAIAVNERTPDCEQFQFPDVSAFDGYMPREQPSPFRRS